MLQALFSTQDLQGLKGRRRVTRVEVRTFTVMGENAVAVMNVVPYQSLLDDLDPPLLEQSSLLLPVYVLDSRSPQQLA